MFLSKRGQFYLIISIILAVAVFGVTARANSIEEAILFEDFEDLTDNYISESEYVVNNALENKSNVEDELDEFTLNYLEYSKQRNPNVQLLYVYSDGTEATLVNHFDSSIYTTDTAPISGASEDLNQNIQLNVGGTAFSYKVPIRAERFGYEWYSGPVPSDFNLSVGGFLHTFDLSASGPELKVLINLEEGQAKYTYNPGSGGYEFLASPPANDEIRQVKLRT